MDNRIFIQYDENNIIYYTHYKPFDATHGLHKSEKQLMAIGALVNEFPNIEPQEGKEVIYKYNKETNEVYGEYKDAPVIEDTDEISTMKSDIDTLSAENQSTMIALTEVYEMMLGMMDMQLQIDSLQEQINALTNSDNSNV